MALCILRILVDISWYFAFMMPIVSSVPKWVSGVLAAIPCVWAVRMLIKWNNALDIAGELPESFVFEVRFLAVASLFELFFLGIPRWQKQCGPFVFAFLAAGILLLRIGRFIRESGAGTDGQTGQARFWTLNLVHVGAALAVAILCVSGTVRHGVAQLVGTVYRVLILPILEGLIFLFIKAVESLTPLLRLIFGDVEQLEIEPPQMNTSAIADDLDPVALQQFPAWVRGLGSIILAALAIGLLVWLYRRLSGLASYHIGETAGTAVRSRVAEQSGERPAFKRFGGEKDVRYYYRKFLKLCAARGLTPGAPVTSGAVCDAAAECWDEKPLSELRDLYRSVRYGAGPEDTNDRKRAAELYRELKKRSNEKTG